MAGMTVSWGQNGKLGAKKLQLWGQQKPCSLNCIQFTGGVKRSGKKSKC